MEAVRSRIGRAEQAASSKLAHLARLRAPRAAFALPAARRFCMPMLVRARAAGDRTGRRGRELSGCTPPSPESTRLAPHTAALCPAQACSSAAGTAGAARGAADCMMPRSASAPAAAACLECRLNKVGRGCPAQTHAVLNDYLSTLAGEVSQIGGRRVTAMPALRNTRL